jgi:hypothetical protein
VVQACSRGPTSAQYFLGLFVLWQLFFLFASNIGGLIQDVQNHTSYLPRDWSQKINRVVPGLLGKKDRVNDVLVTIEGNTDRWAYLTCQPQSWRLFAPNAGKDATFVAVELRWDDGDPLSPGKADRFKKGSGTFGRSTLLAVPAKVPDPFLNREAMPYAPELLLSENEPRDPRSFFRMGQFRLRKYESNLDVSLTLTSGDDLAAIAEEWERQIKDRLSNRWDNIHAYFLCRFRDYQKRHPERPMPRQMILHVRRYDIPGPDQFSTSWYFPDSLPMVRWKPPVINTVLIAIVGAAPGISGVTEDSPYYRMERYVPSAFDVLCSARPAIRAHVNPEVLALMAYWPQPAQPLAFALAGIQHRIFIPGHFVVLN